MYSPHTVSARASITQSALFRWRVMALALAAILALVGLSAAATTAARAAETGNVTVSGLTFVQETVTDGQNAQISGNWSIADSVTAGQREFTIDLPSALTVQASSFAMTAEDDAVVGSCEVTETTFETTYGDLVIDVTPGAGTCVTNCGFTGRDPLKYGAYAASPAGVEGAAIQWSVLVASGATGMEGGEEVTVTEVNFPNMEIVRGPELYRTNQILATGTGGAMQPDNFTSTLGSENPVVSDDGLSLSFTAEEGYFYSVRYWMQPTDGGSSVTYSNEATVAVDSVVETVERTVTWSGGNASGVGADRAKFSVRKVVEGDTDTPELEDQVYTVNYTVTEPSGDVHTGSIALAADETWVSGEFESGSELELEEVTPSGPAGVTWTASFSQNDFTMPGGSNTLVTLTNTADYVESPGGFAVAKELAGSGAGLVPQDTEFTVEYSYPAGDGFAAGEGVPTVKADGVAVESGDLPFGAVVTLSEVAPSVDGVEFAGAEFSPSTVTIGDGTITEVTL